MKERRFILTSRIPTVILLSVLCLTACKTVQTATDTNQNHIANQVQRDSIYLHDSIFVRIRADTVYLEKWHTRWREKEITRTDTIHVETTKTETVQVRYVPKFYKYCAALTALLLLFLIIKFALWLYKRFHP